MPRIDEINRRRTFAIISHPDAGKTTLTEKLLLFGGAIRTAGAVKSNKIKKTATSDFMEIEKQRGISVATSVMGFEYAERKINILDTPGHKDFAEDTYRTLTAADSVIVVIDAAKGVEEQTENLVRVCRMRNTPMIIFVNKLDRPGKDPLELLDEIEDKLDLQVTPLSWPAGHGLEFQGVYNIYKKSFNLFRANTTEIEEKVINIDNLESSILDEHLPDHADKLREDVELAGAYPNFSREDYLQGKICPVFFGSALNNFGVKELLETFVNIAPSPTGGKTNIREIDPYEDKFTGFVFKIHANIDPNHRNRIAFLRICSGKFERNKNYRHSRLARNFRISSPTSFMADKKETIEVAYPGDIIGIPDTGNFKIGDTLTEGEDLKFIGIPNFSPENFKYVENNEPLKSKQLTKGLDQLMDEGVAQMFTRVTNNRRIIGTVGELQFEVIQYRLKHEYGASVRFEPIPLYKACWVKSNNEAQLKEFMRYQADYMTKDKFGKDVFLAETSWTLQRMEEKYPDVKFLETSEINE